MGDVIQSQPEALDTMDRRSFIGRVLAWTAANRLATGGLAGALTFAEGCGDDDNDRADALSSVPDQDRSSSAITENTLKKTDNLKSGESQTVEGGFVTDVEVHCDYHREDMDFDVTVDHTATTAVGQEVETHEITMIDNDFLDREGNPVDEIQVDHGKRVKFKFTNDGNLTHNAMLSGSGEGAHADH